MNAKGDKNRSVRSTRRSLQKAMVELLKEKPIERITVRELADMADINRATFYLHYKDVYDLLEQMEQAAISEMQEFLTSDAIKDFSSNGYPMVEQIFSYLYEHQERFSVLFGPNGRKEIRKQVIDINTEFLLSIMDKEQSFPCSMELEMGARFLFAGAFEVLERQMLRGESFNNEELIQFYSHITQVVFESFSYYTSGH